MEAPMTMMEELMRRNDVLERDTSLTLDILRGQPGANNLSALMRSCIKPKGTDERDQSWSSASKERVTNLEQACRSYNLALALKNGQLVRPEVPSPGEERFLTLVDQSRELAGLTKALSWLRSLQKTVESDNPVRVLNELVQLGVSNPRGCDCHIEFFQESATLVWIHMHHQWFNRAAWEIISSRPNLLAGLRSALEADIAGPSKREGRKLCGEISSRAFARNLLAFFAKAKPSPIWVGDSPRPS